MKHSTFILVTVSAILISSGLAQDGAPPPSNKPITLTKLGFPAPYEKDQLFVCPIINCDTTLGEFTCYQHSNTVPVTEINTFFCPYDRACDLEENNYAWIASKLQHISTD